MKAKLLVIALLIGILVCSGCLCCCTGPGGGSNYGYSSKKSYGESCDFDSDCESDDCSYGYCS